VKQRAVTVDALIIRDNKVLLIKRGHDPYEGYWALPGGYVDWDETVEEAIAREVKEEVGLDVTETKFFGVYSTPLRHPRQVIAISFLLKTSGDPVAGDDANEAKFFDFADIPDKLAFDHSKMLQDFTAQKA
jgi:ADP-ribose pyrophosphatase YjhB (NUDIX family)